MRGVGVGGAVLACALLVGCRTLATHPAASVTAQVDAAPEDGAAPPSPNGESNGTGEHTESKSADEAAWVASANQPPCLPADSKAKSPPKHKPRAAAHSTPASAPADAPPPAPSGLTLEATIKPLALASASILGKQVSGSTGDDLGRVVDVLADASGHVQIAVIETGGFLGLGNRRIAVDWALLKFHPEDPQGSVTLNVSKRRLQSAPEYRDAAHPFALMAPAAPLSEGKK